MYRKRSKLLQKGTFEYKSTAFLQGDAFPRKPTEESNENIDFAIYTTPQCLTTPLNSTNCDGNDDILKIKLDEKLK